MAKIIKRTDGNGDTLFFGTHTDAVQVEEAGAKKSLTEVLGRMEKVVSIVPNGMRGTEFTLGGLLRTGYWNEDMEIHSDNNYRCLSRLLSGNGTVRVEDGNGDAVSFIYRGYKANGEFVRARFSQTEVDLSQYDYVGLHFELSVDLSGYRLVVTPNVSLDGLSADVERISADVDRIKNGDNTVVYGSGALDEGYWIIGTRSSVDAERAAMSGYFSLPPVAVKAGDVVTVATNGGTMARAYALTDSGRNILTRADENENTLESPAVLTVAADGFLYVNFRKVSGVEFADFSVSVERADVLDAAKDYTDAAVAQMQERVDSLKDALYGEQTFASSDLEDGKFWYLAGKTNAEENPRNMANYYCLSPVEVKAGDVVTVATNGGVNARAYALTGSDRKILTMADASVNTLESPAVLTVAADGYLYVNFYKTSRVELADFSVSVERGKLLGEAKDYTDAAVARVQEQWNKGLFSAKNIYNPPIDLTKSGLKVLDIGNSYTDGAMRHVNAIAGAAGLNSGYSLYKATRGGGSFKSWVDCYHDADDTKYMVGKVSGDNVGDHNIIVTGGVENAYDGSYFRNTLSLVEWDLIIIHQLSRNMADYDDWEGHSDAGYLKELIRIIRYHNPQATIGFLLVHSSLAAISQSGLQMTTSEFWEEVLVKSTRKMVASYGVDFVIPYGTAVQNLRESSISEGKDEFLQYDNGAYNHLAEGIGEYVASCCYFQSLLAPRCGACVIGNTYRKTDFDESGTGVLNIDNTNAPLAQKAAFLAVCDWYSINNPDDFSL